MWRVCKFAMKFFTFFLKYKLSFNAIKVAMVASVLAHMSLLALDFKIPKNDKSTPLPKLEVILVNNQSGVAPSKVYLLSQVSLNGGGNTTKELNSQSNLPHFEPVTRESLEFSTARIEQLEKVAKKLIDTVDGLANTDDINQILPKSVAGKTPDNSMLIDKQFAIKKLRTKISKDWSEYQKMPKRDFVGAQTKKVVYAEYVDKWREKIEEIGTVNFPKSQDNKAVLGNLLVTVSIRSDGSLVDVKLERSSGQTVLDNAVTKIVKLSSPFAPFPIEMEQQTDILSITRNWSFTRSDLIVTDDL